MSTYENDLRLEEIGTGERSGTWGTATNTNLELIANALSYSATGEAIANASTHTITMQDGVADEARSFYLKCTGGGQACTVTLAPNTLSKVWMIENTTSYTLTFSQGSGANVAVLAGQVKMIATDGAGTGGAVFDLMQDLAVPDLFVDDDLTLQSDAAVLGFGADKDVTLTHVADTGLLLNAAMKVQFRDAAISVSSSADATLDLAADGDINLTAGVDINIPANVGLTFGNDGEKIEGDGTDLTIAGNNINLTAVADVVIPANVGLTFGTGEKIEGDSTDLTVTSGADINLTATADVNIPSGVGLTFGDDGEKIEGDGTDLTITGNNINLTATADVIIPANVGITFGTGEKIEGDSTDLTITSGAKINLTATSDVVVPANVGITFGTGEKIEGDNTDLTITSGAKINLAATSDVHLANDIGMVFGDAGEKIEGDGTNLAINSSGDVNITATTVDLDGNLEVSGTITLGSGAVISEAELEMLDGITAGTVAASKAVVVDANKDAASFRNLTSTGAVTAGSFVIGSADINENDLEAIDGITAGTVAASKAMVVDTNKDITGGRNLTITGELDAATGDFSGNVDIDGDLLVGDDLTLDSDAAVLGFGADTDVTLTHVADTGLLLNGTMAIQFNDASQFINAPSATVLDINATDEIELNATLVDVNANLDVSGTVTATGTSVFASLDISGDIDVDGTTNLDAVDIDGAVDMASTLAVAGVVTANAGVVVDNITIDGSEIDLSSGNLTIDVAGYIIIDSDDGNIYLNDDGAGYGQISGASQNLTFKSSASNKDMIFQGNDGGAPITALTLDMSEGGQAIFNAGTQATSSVLTNFLNIQVDDAELYFTNTANNRYHVFARDASNNLSLKRYDGSSTSTDVVFDSSGNIGMFGDGGVQTIDHYTNYTTLTLGNATGAIIQFEDDGNAIGEIFNGTDHFTVGAAESGASLILRAGAGAEVMRLLSTGNVGIGTSAPTAPLTVKSPANAEAIHIVGRSDDIGQIIFFEADGSTNLARVDARNNVFNVQSNAAIPMTLGTSSTARVTVETNGNLTIEDGNLVIGTSGHGIDFSAGAAGASTGNLLDEYEEGTFTPTQVYQNATNNSAASVNAAAGRYTKIGNVVHFTIRMNVEVPSSLATDNYSIQSLPFASENVTSVDYVYSAFLNSKSLVTNPILFMHQPNQTVAFMTDVQGTGNGGPLMGGAGSGTSELNLTGTYRTS